MKRNFLQGLIAAPFTPMDKDGNLNINPISSYVNLLINNGVNGAFICGTTGEVASLQTEEKKIVVEEWINCSNNQLKIIVHVGGICQSDCIELAEYASKKGADAIAAMAPFFFKPSAVEDLLLFLEPIAAAAPDLPFYYYHIPSMTGVNIPVFEILNNVSEKIPNFAGVKFTHSDLMDLQKSLSVDGDRYEILFGSDEILIAGLSLGIDSAVGSTYNYMASIYLNLIQAFQNGDHQLAIQYQQNSIKVIDIVNRYGGPISAGKTIMKFLGVDCGPCRLPLRKISISKEQMFRKELENVGYFKFVNSEGVKNQ